METLEEKRSLLSYFGISLTFPTFTILGINGEDYSTINFEVDALSHRTITYYWQIVQEDWDNFSIDKDMSFTTTVAHKTLTWKLIQKPFIDNYGWVRLTANLVNIV